MKLFDVHTHIQDIRFSKVRDEIIERSTVGGVEKIMCCGTCEGDWEAVLEIENRYKPVISSLGIHPWFVEGRGPDWIDKLETLIKNSSACIGEIGLDRMISNRNDSEQEKVFIEQLKLSHKYRRPVSIHCRKAWGVLPGLIKDNGGLPFGGVIHSWSGSVEMVKIFEDLGAYISFSGSVTRDNNKKAHKACKAVSRERLLIETDSPDILPSGVDAELNEPLYVRNVLEMVASIRGEKKEDVALYTFENALQLFEGSK